MRSRCILRIVCLYYLLFLLLYYFIHQLVSHGLLTRTGSCKSRVTVEYLYRCILREGTGNPELSNVSSSSPLNSERIPMDVPLVCTLCTPNHLFPSEIRRRRDEVLSCAHTHAHTHTCNVYVQLFESRQLCSYIALPISLCVSAPWMVNYRRRPDSKAQTLELMFFKVYCLFKCFYYYAWLVNNLLYTMALGLRSYRYQRMQKIDDLPC